LFDKVSQALQGGAAILQYREKALDTARRKTRALKLKRLCQDHEALFLINDDVALCVEVGADGVHIGRDDGHLAEVRAAVGAECLIGVSCYDQFERARAALHGGAHYVAFGSVFASSVKPDAVRAPLCLISLAARELSLPVVAIGGIDHGNAGEVIDAGADSVAVISALFDAPDVRASACAFAKLFSSHVSQRVERS